MTLESFTQRTMIWDLTRDRRGKTTSRRWPLPMPDVKKSRHLEAALSGDGKLLAVRNADRSVSLWDLRQKKERVTFPAVQDRDVHGLAVSPDGSKLVLGCGAKSQLDTTSDALIIKLPAR